MKIKTQVIIAFGLFFGAIFSTIYLGAVIQGTNGIAVSGNNSKWNDVRDTSTGDNLTSGIIASGLYFNNGSNGFSMVRGTITNGINVNLGNSTVSINSSGNNFYAITDSLLSNSSVAYAFGFISKLIIVEAPSTNSANICVNWLGNSSAVCPGNNTSGHDILPAGHIVTLDNYAVSQLTAIATNGNQTISIRAFK